MSDYSERAADLLQRAEGAVESETSLALSAQAQGWIALAQLEKLGQIEDHLDYVKECLRSIDTTLGMQTS